MALRRRHAWVVALLLAGASLAQPGGAAQKDDKDANRRPRLNLRAQPSAGISPARIALTLELIGGADDFEDYYCPTLRWEWGDDTVSESETDCPPYEAGKSEIRRRVRVEHVFRRAGAYKVYIRLKQRSRDVAVTSTTVQIQPGADERY